MERVLVLGPGASGKSTLARALADATGMPKIELDQVFWSAGLEPTPPERWVEVQHELAAGPRWIMDGDLGPYDMLEVRLRRADTVIVFDLPTWRCAVRAVRRSRERLDFWRWLLTWRRSYRPRLMRAIEDEASAAVFVIRDRHDLARVTAEVIRRAGAG